MYASKSDFKPSWTRPTANFSSNVTNGTVPLTVKFTDLSNNATAWKWDFGDKTSSTKQNPVHTYNKAGKYTVSLIVGNPAGTNEIKRSYIITVKKH